MATIEPALVLGCGDFGRGALSLLRPELEATAAGLEKVVAAVLLVVPSGDAPPPVPRRWHDEPAVPEPIVCVDRPDDEEPLDGLRKSVPWVFLEVESEPEGRLFDPDATLPLAWKGLFETAWTRIEDEVERSAERALALDVERELACHGISVLAEPVKPLHVVVLADISTAEGWFLARSALDRFGEWSAKGRHETYVHLVVGCGNEPVSIRRLTWLGKWCSKETDEFVVFRRCMPLMATLRDGTPVGFDERVSQSFLIARQLLFPSTEETSLLREYVAPRFPVGVTEENHPFTAAAGAGIWLSRAKLRSLFSMTAGEVILAATACVDELEEGERDRLDRAVQSRMEKIGLHAHTILKAICEKTPLAWAPEAGDAPEPSTRYKVVIPSAEFEESIRVAPPERWVPLMEALDLLIRETLVRRWTEEIERHRAELVRERMSAWQAALDEVLETEKRPIAAGKRFIARLQEILDSLKLEDVVVTPLVVDEVEAARNSLKAAVATLPSWPSLWMRSAMLGLLVSFVGIAWAPSPLGVPVGIALGTVALVSCLAVGWTRWRNASAALGRYRDAVIARQEGSLGTFVRNQLEVMRRQLRSLLDEEKGSLDSLRGVFESLRSCCASRRVELSGPGTAILARAMQEEQAKELSKRIRTEAEETAERDWTDLVKDRYLSSWRSPDEERLGRALMAKARARLDWERWAAMAWELRYDPDFGGTSLEKDARTYDSWSERFWCDYVESDDAGSVEGGSLGRSRVPERPRAEDLVAFLRMRTGIEPRGIDGE